MLRRTGLPFVGRVRCTRRPVTVLLGGLALLTACRPFADDTDDGDDAVRPRDMHGHITAVTPTENRPSGSDWLGTILVEGPREGNPISDKARVSIMTKTTIVSGSGGSGTFADLRVGSAVEVWFDGPVRESYPVQVDAGRIVVVESQSRADSPGAAAPANKQQPAAGDAQSRFDMHGSIVTATPAENRPSGSDWLGTILVEGPREGNPISDKARVAIMTKTRIVVRRGASGTRGTFADLRVGSAVEVTFDGPIRESDPIQVDAAEIVVVAS